MPRKAKAPAAHDEKTMDEILRICLLAHNSRTACAQSPGAWEEVAREQNNIAVFLCEGIEKCMVQMRVLEEQLVVAHEKILLHDENMMREVSRVSAHALRVVSAKAATCKVVETEVEQRAWREVARLAETAHKMSKKLHAKELQVAPFPLQVCTALFEL